VFLISADFLDSWYCFHVELNHALSRIANAEITVIPLIVRPCQWQMTNLKNFVAVPKDGVAITSWQNADEAYSDAVGRIEESAKKLRELRRTSAVETTKGGCATRSCSLSVADKFAAFLQETEITFSSKFKDHVSLADIYVFPDLVDEKKEYEEFETYVDSSSLTAELQSNCEFLVHGAEQSGKTALSKVIFNELIETGSIPLWVNGQDIGSSDVKKLVRRALREQYDGVSDDAFGAFGINKILIIDDFNLVKLNAKYLPNLMRNLRDTFDSLLFISDSSIKYDEDRYSELFDFEQLRILPFGNIKRNELIDKWNSLGREETIPLDELYAANDSATRYLNTLIRRNVLPPKPVYVLTTLSLLDASKPTDLSLSSYGHCYQVFIQQAFYRVGVANKDIDSYINYLSELAFYIYDQELQLVGPETLEKFEALYREKYVVRQGLSFCKGLLHSGILHQHTGGLAFGYKYIYYFYVAKYFTDHLDVRECKAAIEKLCWDIHSERNASILVFVVHHSKDPMIITEILDRSALVFEGFDESTLVQEEVIAIEAQVAQIPEIVLEARQIEEERGKRLKLRDDKERIENGNDDSDEIHGKSEDPEIQSEILADISRSYRMVEVIGQVLRNRYGSLPKSQLFDLAEAAYATPLRFLRWFIDFMVSQEREILSIAEHFVSQDDALSNKQVEKRARSMYLSMCYSTALAVIIKIANSVGSEPLIPIFDQLLEKHHASPVMQLIGVAIKLEFTKKIPKKEIKDLNHSLEGNPLVQRLLHEIVVRHLYLNPVSFGDRGWIASTLKLKIRDQRLIQSKKQKRV
ncbi:MAG: hypothetical protein DRR42_27185, partial [Gammaproteobacteria bacterium]